MTGAENQEKHNKNVMDAILRVVEGGDPEKIAQDVGMDTQQLVTLSDSFVRENYQDSLLGEAAQRKIGRNESCPCGSGKKYKKCCLRKHERIKDLLRGSVDFQQEEAQEGPPEYVVKGFDLLATGKNEEAIAYAEDLLSTHPDDDRLHDTLGSALLASGQYDRAVDIGQSRWEVAKEEKSFFIEHGHHKRLPQEEGGAAPHFYSPETWMEKYWIALKSREYSALMPDPRDPEMNRLIEDLLTANDQERFPGQQEEGLEERKKALEPTIDQLKAAGPDAIPYLLQIMGRFSWAALFVPEILAHYGTELAIRSLIDITMFSYHYVSESCLKQLEALGPDSLLPHIRAAFERDKEFDALKVGMINLLGNLDSPLVDDLLVELLESGETDVVDWAGLAIGKRTRTDLLPVLEEASTRIGNKPRITWAISHLRKLEEDKTG